MIKKILILLLISGIVGIATIPLWTTKMADKAFEKPTKESPEIIKQALLVKMRVGDYKGGVFYYNTPTNGGVTVYFKVRKRSDSPTITTYNPLASNSSWRNEDAGTDATAVVQNPADNCFAIRSTSFSSSANRWHIHWTANAEL